MVRFAGYGLGVGNEPQEVPVGCDRKSMMMMWQALAAKPSSGVFLPLSGWVDPGELDTARAYGEMRGKSSPGTFTATPCLQYANDIRSPAGQTTIGTSISADGILDPGAGTSIATASQYRFVRAGWWVVGDGTNLTLAMLAGVIVLYKA